jgi:hypothetical protein
VASLIWLIVWLVNGTPDLEWFGRWNDWSVALLACIVFDVASGGIAGRRLIRPPRVTVSGRGGGS